MKREFKLLEDYGFFKKWDVVRLIKDYCIPLRYLSYAEEETFKIGEQVAVSDFTKEGAIENLKSDVCKYYYTGWINKNWEHIVQILPFIGDIRYIDVKYIAKIPNKKQITIEVSEEQEKFINNYLEKWKYID